MSTGLVHFPEEGVKRFVQCPAEGGMVGLSSPISIALIICRDTPTRSTQINCRKKT